MTQSEETMPEQAATPAAPAEEKKPARKRTVRAKKADASGEAAAEATGAAAASTEEAPKPRRTRTRKTAEAAADAGAEGAGAAKAPRRRKKAADEGDAPAAAALAASPADAAGDALAAEDAPKLRRSRTRKAAGAEKTDGSSEGTSTAEGEAPKQRRRRAADAQAADAAQAAAPETSDATAAPEGGKKAKPADAQADEQREGKSEGRKNDRRNRNDRNRGNQHQGGKNARNDNHRRQRRQHERERERREVAPSVTREELEALKVADLRARAAELELDVTGLKKAELVEAVYAATMRAEGFIEVTGVLDILADGYGFLRASGYLPGEGDAYVGTSTIRRNGLRKGDLVVGQTRPARENEKFAAIQKVISVNGIPVDELGVRPRFADLTPIFPDERLVMEHGKNTITARVIDLAAPIGKGQRGLIVSPPKAGKTTVLKNIAAAITANNPEVHLMYLGIDERPEEATDMERSIRGEVVSSTFDMPCENHIAVAELVIERAKRLVEMGKDVVILLDSITRLARAYNLAQPASGRILSGGVDSTALYPPKRFLGAARNIEGGGSLTILASALIETGSKMDEVIFEEFKGTGNMELKLDRNLADRRVFPAIDPITSGTRKEELLLDPQEAPLIWAVRRILANMNNTERAMDMLIKSLKKTETNQEFLIRTAKKAQMQHGKSDESFEF